MKVTLPPSSDEKLLAAVDEIQQVVTESYQDIRETIDSLNIEEETVSLLANLSSYTEQLGKRTGCEVSFVAPPALPPLHPVAQLQLLSITQEALNNIRKHAAATRVWVKLEVTPPGIELIVKDNGRGFSPAESKGNGLRIMEERASSINAILTVTSTPGNGTEVKVKVPRR